MPQNNGLVELIDSKQNERGFNCMKLIEFLTERGVKIWEQWHGAHVQAASGDCPFASECEIHAKTRNIPGRQLSLTLFLNE